MKKISVILLLGILVFSANAQKLNLGLKFIPNISWMKSEAPLTIANDGIGFGYSYGLTIDYNFTNNYCLNIDLLSTNINLRSEHKDSISIFSKWKHQYVAIPLAIKMKTNRASNNLLYFGKIGIAPMIKTSAKLSNVNNSDQINFFNTTLQIGGGVHYYLGEGNTAIVGGLTFHNGLMRFNNKKANIFPNIDLTTVSLTSSFIAIDLGIIF